MAHPHDLTISELMKILADKTLHATNDAEFEKLSTHDIQSACTLLPSIHTALRRAANLRARVNSLPTEVLLNIFTFIPQAPVLTAFNTVQSICGPLTARQVWELRTVTQVCHRWRSVALEVSSLWSSAIRKPPGPSVSTHSAISENACYLQRCKVGPIQMYIEEDGGIFSTWGPLTPIDAPQGYEDRVEELHVVTIDGWTHGFLPPSLSSLQLNSLQRLVVRSLHSETIETSAWQWHGLQPIFQGQTLPLRSLAIIDSPFLPSNPTPALTRLVLFYDMKREMRETWDHCDLLRFLSAISSTLEEAVICGIPCWRMDGRAPDGPVHLTSIRKLSIRCWDYQNPGSPQASFNILPYIVAPRSCYFRVDADSDGALYDLYFYLRDRLGDVRASNVHCVWASSPYTMSSLQATLPDPDGGGVRVDFPALLDRIPRGNPPFGLGSLLEIPAFAAAQALWVSGPGIDNACGEGLTQPLGSLRGVRALYVAGDPSSGVEAAGSRFVESLAVPVPTLSNSTPELPFPILETLYVTVCDRAGVEKLAEMLHRRAAQGCGLSHLLVRCAAVGDELYDGGEGEEGEGEGAAIPGGSEDQLCLALRGAAGKVTVLSEDGYRKEYALQTVLPPVCTRPGGGLIWPPWTENETTFALMHLT